MLRSAFSQVTSGAPFCLGSTVESAAGSNKPNYYLLRGRWADDAKHFKGQAAVKASCLPGNRQQFRTQKAAPQSRKSSC